jgi:hypothetical protein
MQPSDFPDHQLRIIDTATCRLQVAHPAEVLKQKQRGAALHLDPAEVAHGRTHWAVSGELATEADLTPVARRAELAILTGAIDAARCGRARQHQSRQSIPRARRDENQRQIGTHICIVI